VPTSRLRAPYDVLCRVIGNPMHRPNPGERVAWQIDLDGAKARVHSHDDDKPVQLGERTSIFESPTAIWHVEADDDAQLTWVCAHVAERVIESISKTTGPRTLSAADKVELNNLMKHGMSLSEAMKRVQLRADDKQARSLYAWPMKDMPLPFAPAPTSAAAALDDDEEDEDGEDGEHGDAPAPSPKTTAKSTTPSAATTTTTTSTTSTTTTATKTASTATKTASTATKTASSTSLKQKVAIGPPIPADVPRDTIDAPFAKLVAILGAPEDKPIPFVSTRWRFVLAGSRVLRWEDEPSDDPRDVDASIFDRMSRFDQPYLAREAKSAVWTVTSSSKAHLDAVIAWLADQLQR
jgi:hypothetical protein